MEYETSSLISCQNVRTSRKSSFDYPNIAGYRKVNPVLFVCGPYFSLSVVHVRFLLWIVFIFPCGFCSSLSVDRVPYICGPCPFLYLWILSACPCGPCPLPLVDCVHVYLRKYSIPGRWDLYSPFTGGHSDDTLKGGVVCTEILLPSYAPPEFSDRQTLWNAVEDVAHGKKIIFCIRGLISNQFMLYDANTPGVGPGTQDQRCLHTSNTLRLCARKWAISAI